MQFSEFGKKFGQTSGIMQLMDDLGKAMAGSKDMLMLGGGNPAHIPEVETLFQARLKEILNDKDEFAHVIGDYDCPQGETEFITSLATLLSKEFNWKIGPENIAITLGSQSSFFALFNSFAGTFPNGARKKILLPLAPEYIGYADVGLTDNFFSSSRPKIEYLDDNLFKYHVDFDALNVTDEIGAICVSRPTNPTGNVLTDTEIEKLGELAKTNDIPMIIDNAYGTPFPNIIFTDAKPVWNENTVVCMSLSKLGLPGARTGVVIARKEIIDVLSSLNAIMSLAPTSIGPALALKLVRNGDIIRISREIIMPYYKSKAEAAVDFLREQLDGVDYRIHKPEGALFLWLWCKDLPITSQELYERIKNRGAIVVSGHHFFPGLENDDWRHKQECIRITYSQEEETVRKGLTIIAEEVRSAYRN